MFLPAFVAVTQHFNREMPVIKNGDVLNLSTVTVEELRESLVTLSVGETIQPPHDMADRFVHKRTVHFRQQKCNVINPGKFLETLPKAERTRVSELVSKGHWAWSDSDNLTVGTPSVGDVSTSAETAADRSFSASVSVERLTGPLSLGEYQGACESGDNVDQSDKFYQLMSDIKRDINVMHSKMSDMDDKLNKNLSALRQHVDDKFTDMSKHFDNKWSKLSTDLSDLDKDMRAELSNLDNKFETEIQVINGDVSNMSVKVSALADKSDVHEKTMADIDSKVCSWNDKMNTIDKTHGDNIIAVRTDYDHRLDAVSKRLDTMSDSNAINLAAVKYQVNANDAKLDSFKRHVVETQQDCVAFKEHMTDATAKIVNLQAAVRAAPTRSEIDVLAQDVYTKLDATAAVTANVDALSARINDLSTGEHAEMRTPVADFMSRVSPPVMHSTMVSREQRYKLPTVSEFVPPRQTPVRSSNTDSVPITVTTHGAVLGSVYIPHTQADDSGRVSGHAPNFETTVRDNRGQSVRPSVSLPAGAAHNTVLTNTVPANTVSNVTTANTSSFLGNSRNSSVRVKEPSTKLPTFNAVDTKWSIFIRDFEDIISEMGWEGQELSKFKLCLTGKAKELFRSFHTDVQGNFQRVKENFTALFGDTHERARATRQLFKLKQQPDQTLDDFVMEVTLLANKAYPVSSGEAAFHARQAFLDGCIHTREANFVTDLNISTLQEAVAEVRRLVDVAQTREKPKVRAFSPSASRSDDGRRDFVSSSRRRDYSPDRFRRDFSPRGPRREFSPMGRNGRESDRYRSEKSPERWSRRDFDSHRPALKPSQQESNNRNLTFSNELWEAISKINSKLDVLNNSSPSQSQDAMNTRDGSVSPRAYRSPDRRSVSPVVCFRCKKTGHYQRDCPEPPSPGRADNDRQWRSPSPSSSPKAVRFSVNRSTSPLN